jgi:hypothetical protein
MAMDMADDQPAMTEHAGHVMQASADEKSQGCDRCPPGASHVDSPCADGLNADCGAVFDYNADSRNLNLKLKYKDVNQVAVLPEVARTFSVVERSPPRLIPVNRLRYRSGPSLSILNCVFLPFFRLPTKEIV